MMDLHELIDGVMAGRIAPVSAPAEADYHLVWLEYQVNTSDPFVASALGGALADRLAWVFLAGYQGTIRRCFPALPTEPGWCAFVNTEGSGGLPGTALTTGSGERRLTGWKTWVAGADHVDRLLVSASHEHLPFCVVRREHAGVRILSGPPSAYLPELVQGRVEFQDVAISPDQLTGDERTFPAFRASESAYIRAALFAFMLAHSLRLEAPPELIASALTGVLTMESLLCLPLPSEAATIATLGASRQCEAVAAEFAALIESRDQALFEHWTRDARLVYGASSGTLTRAEEAIARVQNR
jgi:hypothetical protein